MASRRKLADTEAILHSLTQTLKHIHAQVDSDALFLHRSKWGCLARSYTVVLDTVREFATRINNPGMLIGPLVLLSDVMQAAERFLMECICSIKDRHTCTIDQVWANMVNALMFGMSKVIEDTHLHDLLWCVSVFDRASQGMLVGITAKLFEIWADYVDEKGDVAATLRFLETEASLHMHKKEGEEILLLTSFITKKLSLAPEVERAVTNVLPEHLWVDPKDLDRDNDPIGKGANAYVFQAEWLGGQYAVKDFFYADYEMFEREAAIQARLRHPNVVQLICCTKDLSLKRRKCSLVMELLQTDLRTLLEERMEGEDGSNFKQFSLLTAVDLMLQIAKGMEYLHSHHIIHRDLKSLNILVGFPKIAGDNPYTHLHLKIADFGMSEAKHKSSQYTASSSKLGTTQWRAPEIFLIDPIGSDQQRAKYTVKADVYSFALICSEILTGRIPFDVFSPLQQYNVMQEGVRPNLPSNCPSVLASCIKQCWSWEASQRPTFTQICRMLRHIKACIVLAADDETLAKQMLFCAAIPDETHGLIDEYMQLKKGKVRGGTMDIPLEMECCQDVFKGIIVSPDPAESPVENIQTNDENILSLQKCIEIQEHIQMMVDTPDLVFLHHSKWQCLAKSYSLVLEALRHVQKLLQHSSEYRPSMFIGPVTLFCDVLQEGETFLMNCSKSCPSESLDRAACLSNMTKVLRFAMSTEILDAHLHDLLWCVCLFDRAWKDMDVFRAGALVLYKEAQFLGQEIGQVWVDANEEKDRILALQFMYELKEFSARDDDTEMSVLADFILHKLTPWPTEDADYFPPYLWVDPKSFKRSDYNTLGAGSYALIFSAVWLGGQTVAMKHFFSVDDEVFGKEAAIQARLQHANVMALVCCTKDVKRQKCTIVMEEMQQDLRALIRERLIQGGASSPPFSFLTAVDLMLQIAKGMEYLHSLHIMHRDLKTSNILVSFPTASKVHVRIADFGMAKAKLEMYDYSTLNVGTPQWRAPEVFDSMDSEEDLYQSYTKKADVYSFAIVCSEVLTGNAPFEGSSRRNLRARIMNGERPRLPPSCPPVLSNYIKECWHADPIRRPTFTEICIMLRHIKACIVLSFHQKPALQMLSCQVKAHPKIPVGAQSGGMEGLLRMLSDMEFCRDVFTRHVKSAKHEMFSLAKSDMEFGRDVFARHVKSAELHEQYGHRQQTGAISAYPIQTHRHGIIWRRCLMLGLIALMAYLAMQSLVALLWNPVSFPVRSEL